MARPGRWRRWGKWAGLGVSTALLAGWVLAGWVSLFWVCNVGNGWVWVGVGAGCLRISKAHSTLEAWQPWPGQFLYRWMSPPHWRCWPTIEGRLGRNPCVEIPVWVIGVPVTALTALWWRRDRRRIPGACPRCGYDLSGVPSGLCPECGRGM